MGILDLFRRRAEPVETRAAMSGFTAEIMAARESYISGRRGIAELTATVQTASRSGKAASPWRTCRGPTFSTGTLWRWRPGPSRCAARRSS